MKKIIGLGLLLSLISCDTFLGSDPNLFPSSSSDVYAMIIPTQTAQEDPLEETEVQEVNYDSSQQFILPGVALETKPLHHQEHHHSSQKKVWKVNGQVKETEETEENDGNLHQKERWVDKKGKKHETDNWTTQDGSVYQCHKWEDDDGCVHESHQVTQLDGAVSKKHFKKNKFGQVSEVNDNNKGHGPNQVPLVVHNPPGKRIGKIRHAPNCPLGRQH